MAFRKIYQAKLSAKLDELNAELKLVRVKAEKAKIKVNKKIDQDMALLRKKQKVARRQAAELRRSGDDAWKDIKKSVESAWKDLHRGLVSARKRFD